MWLEKIHKMAKACIKLDLILRFGSIQGLDKSVEQKTNTSYIYQAVMPILFQKMKINFPHWRSTNLGTV